MMNNQNQVVSYDGTSKSSVGKAQQIPYWDFPAREAKEQAMFMASDEALAFYPSLKCEVECDAATLTQEQWLARRQHTIGGSECSAIFGANDYKSNLQVFYEKTGAQKVQQDEETDDGELNKLWGHICEEYAASWLQKKYPYNKIITDTNIYRLKDKPYITANIDRMMQKPDGSWVLVEIKTAGYSSKPKWENGNIPVSYLYQVKQYMAILGVWEAVVVCVFSRDDIIVNKVTRDLDDEKRIIEGIADFWENHVNKNIPPVANGLSKNIANAKKQYEWVNSGSEVVMFDGSWLAKCQEYSNLQEEKKQLKKQIDAIDEFCGKLQIEFVDELAGNMEGVLEDAVNGCSFMVKYGVRKSADKVDMEKLKALHPDIYQQLLIPGKTSRTFSLKRKAIKK